MASKPAAVDAESGSKPAEESFTLRQRVVLWLITWAGYLLIRVIGPTLRYTVSIEEGGPGEWFPTPSVFVFWHNAIIPACWWYRGRGIAVMTSSSFDGEYIARIIEKFGFRAVRGSSTRGAVRALLGMHTEVEAGRSVAFTIDGPKGPVYVAKPGPVLLARNVGRPIQPFYIAVERAWILNSWDKLRIPKPFSRAHLRVGKPIVVSRETDAESAKALHAEMQAALERVREEAEGSFKHFANRDTLQSRSAAEHHQAGIDLAFAGRFSEAIKQYRAALRLEPSADTFYNLGVAYGELHKWRAAIRAYKRAIQLNPTDCQIYGNLGADYVNAGQFAKAIEVFRRAAELNPEELPLVVSVGFNCGRLRRYSEAIEAYSRALELKPDFAVAWYNISLFRWHQRRYPDAILAAERALAIKPDYGEPYIVIGMARRESGDIDGAVQAFKRAAESSPNLMEAHANLGEAYVQRKQIDVAVRELQWALQLRSDEPSIHRILGLAHWRAKQRVAAVTDWGRAVYFFFGKLLTHSKRV